jgi:hypothetical protein
MWYRPDGGKSADEVADEHARLALAMVEASPLPARRKRRS